MSLLLDSAGVKFQKATGILNWLQVAHQTICYAEVKRVAIIQLSIDESRDQDFGGKTKTCCVHCAGDQTSAIKVKWLLPVCAFDAGVCIT